MNGDRWRVKFRDRRHAGDLLACCLLSHRDQPGLLVLGIPRGGVPVAARVAHALRAEGVVPADLLEEQRQQEERDRALAAEEESDRR